MENKKLIVILIGPPGSGKGTQAELIAEKFGLFNFETSKIIEEKLKNADPDDEIITREKDKWMSGRLNTPEMGKKWVLDKIGDLHKQGLGIVFSGSPRTKEEAEAEMPVFEKLYGKESVKVFNILLSREESFYRNSNRRICEANRHPIPNFPEFKNLKVCPKDGSKLIVRKGLDDPESVKRRYNVYLEETEPVLGFLKQRGYEIMEINGEQGIAEVNNDILDKFNGNID